MLAAVLKAVVLIDNRVDIRKIHGLPGYCVEYCVRPSVLEGSGEVVYGFHNALILEAHKDSAWYLEDRLVGYTMESNPVLVQP